MTHHRAVAGGAQVVEESFGVVDGGLQVHAGGQPLPVQVFPAQGAPVIAIDDTIWVEHGDDLENEVLSQEPGHRVLADQKLQGPLHHPAGIALPWVNAGRHHLVRTLPCRQGQRNVKPKSPPGKSPGGHLEKNAGLS